MFAKIFTLNNGKQILARKNINNDGTPIIDISFEHDAWFISLEVSCKGRMEMHHSFNDLDQETIEDAYCHAVAFKAAEDMMGPIHEH